MHRFFSPSENICAGFIAISDKGQVHHLKDVLRLKIKDKVIIFDEKAREYFCSIEKLSPDCISAQIKYMHKTNSSGDRRLSVACAIPKKAKMDEIIDKLTQLGVERIIPLETERVIVRLDSRKKILRQLRWKKIALESAKQSQRSDLAIIEPIKSMEEALSAAEDFDLKLIPHLSGRRKPLREVLAGQKAKNILVFIGPEGDFSPREINLAKQYGCIPISLGELVLRVDTAAIAVASFIRLYTNNK